MKESWDLHEALEIIVSRSIVRPRIQRGVGDMRRRIFGTSLEHSLICTDIITVRIQSVTSDSRRWYRALSV